MNAKRIVSALGGALLLSASFAALADNNDGGPVAQNAPVDSLAGNQSAPMCTAAINSDGTIASPVAALASAANLGGGTYEVVFKGACTNITAARGWARFVQVDTLTTGSIGDVKCTTADRAGKPNGVWVNCTNGSGVGTPTSFFLMVTR